MSNEMYHAAIKILNNRCEQYGLGDDELMHYGQKGQEWGKHKFGDDETAKNYAKAKAKMLAEKARREGHGPSDANTALKKSDNSGLRNNMSPDLGNALKPMLEGKTGSDVNLSTDGAYTNYSEFHPKSETDKRLIKTVMDKGGNAAMQEWEDTHHKAKDLANNARESGQGPEERPTQRPNTPTEFDMQKRQFEKDHLKTKASILADKARIEGQGPKESELNPNKPAQSNEDKERAAYNGKTINEHLGAIHTAALDSIKAGRQDMVDQVRNAMRASGGTVDDATVQQIKDDAHKELEKAIMTYAKANKLPLDNPDVQRKFNTAYQSMCGHYDDAVDEACKKGRYR